MSGWHMLRVYYYAEDKDGLLLDGVYPLLQRLRADGLIAGGYYERHWLGGPHVRVYFHTTAENWEHTVRPLAMHHLEGYLREYPSTRVLNPEDLKALYQTVSEWEFEANVPSELVPDNTVQEGPATLRAEMYGGQREAEMAREWYLESSDRVFALLAETRGDKEARLRAALALMVGTACAIGPITSTHITFRSHVEGAFVQCRDAGERLRQAFETRYQTMKRSVHEQIQARVAAAGAGESWYTGHVRAVETWYRRLQEEIAAGRFHPPTASELLEIYRRQMGKPPPDWHEMAAGNEFHRTLLEPRWQKFMDESVQFNALRVIINYLYFNLSQLGVKPLERYFLCYLIARSVEDIYNLSTMALVRSAHGNGAGPDGGVAGTAPR